MSNSLKAVLFDVDGTLVDSNDAHAAAWVKATRLTDKKEFVPRAGFAVR